MYDVFIVVNKTLGAVKLWQDKHERKMNLVAIIFVNMAETIAAYSKQTLIVKSLRTS
jgi:hypothetical protein